MATLRGQFSDALTNIEVNGHKRDRAIAAHTEIQDVLYDDEQLRAWGINTRLIGSYSRHTARYPGKDVDVFARFEALDTEAMPRTVYERVQDVLVEEYGLVDDGGRATLQDRSIKVEFRDPADEDDDNEAFAIDAVPAVRDADRWAIPTKDRKRWAERTGRWVTTDPERFGELSSAISTTSFSPSVAGRNAYKPIVKLMRQARHVHLGDRRPGGLFVEFAVYDVWSPGTITGDEWDPLFAKTLRAVANRFGLAPYLPLLDPGMGTAVAPALTDDVWTHAQDVFLGLADVADEAVAGEKCAAAAKWREILGENERGQVFPLPPGCDARGFPISTVAPIAGLGSNEARKFG
jgi:Second Messenger Oligonucleotide or Dinucleotide Synthetase domain